MSTYSEDERPKIPAEVKRRVLVEAGHRCAIPTCRYIEVDLHHIVPWAKCKEHKYENLIALCSNCHKRADRGEIDRKSLHLYKYNLRFLHDKYSNVEMDILFYLGEDRGRRLAWPAFNLILLKRLIDSQFLIVERPGVFSSSFEMETTPLSRNISEKGMAFLLSIKDHEL